MPSPLTDSQIRALPPVPKGGRGKVLTFGDGLLLVNEPVIGDQPCRRFVYRYWVCQISLVVAAGVAATTITRLARNDQKEASALSLDLASKIVTVLDCEISDLLEVVEG